jgi:hypothetical protein
MGPVCQFHAYTGIFFGPLRPKLASLSKKTQKWCDIKNNPYLINPIAYKNSNIKILRAMFS